MDEEGEEEGGQGEEDSRGMNARLPPPPSPPEKSAKEGTSCLRGIRRLIPSSVEINKRNRQLYTRGDRPHSPNPGHGFLDKEAHSVQL